MQLRLAHLRHQGIDFVVFDADARSHMRDDRAEILGTLMQEARRAGLRVDKAALAYRTGGRIEFWGTPDLVRFLANNGLPRWTHTITVQ